MIEKYFELGVRFKWTKPADVIPAIKDGSIVPSIRPTNQLIYDGLDTVVSPKLGVTHVSTLGLTMRMPIAHTWLDYAKGQTAQIDKPANDVLTGFMSGCIIARWQDMNGVHIAHIGTDNLDPAASQRVKQTFASRMDPATVGFNPAKAYTTAELENLSKLYKPPRMVIVLALVTTKGDFYSIAMMPVDGRLPPDKNTEWCAAGIKSVPPMSNAVLKQFLES